MPYIDRGTSRLYYEIHGEGPPVVLLHGVGGNHASWFQQFPGWRERFRMIAIDARGFGNSTDDEGLGCSAFVDDLLGLLDHLDIGRVRLVAQSMGGGTALGITCLHPERIEAVVFADTLVGFELPESIREYMAEVRQSGLRLSQIDRVLGPTFVARQPAMSALYLALASFNTYNIRTLPGEHRRFSTGRLSATGVPALFIAGNEDVLFPVRAIRTVQAEVAGSRFIELSPAGHSAYFEQPDEFNRVVGDWLQQDAG